jgi:micrococcal nuclease
MQLTYRYRKRDGWLGLVILFAVIVWNIADQSQWFEQAGQTAINSQPGLYQVSQFVDGDTITVNMNGKTEKIRMVGVDTPETHKPNTPVQCYGPAAAAFTKNTLGTQKFRLEADPRSTNRDRYDRLLRYVYLTDGRNFNQLLIEQGYGFYYPYFPFTKSTEFAATQKKAQDAHRGLWGNCNPVKTDRGGYVSNSQG